MGLLINIFNNIRKIRNLRMSCLNLLRHSSKSLDVFIRSASSKSLFATQNVTARKSSILLNKPIQSSILLNRANSTVQGGHAKQWNIERYVSLGLFAVIPAALIMENQLTDHLFAAVVMAHSTWGCKMIITDYVHAAGTQKAALGALYGISLLAFIGCLYFNYADIGLAKAVKKLWAL